MELVVFAGVQASGKSTFFAQRFADSHVRINGDMLKTRHREKLLLGACIAGQIRCVIDKTNLTAAERQRYVLVAKAAGFRVVDFYFDAPFELCLRRNGERSLPVPVAGLYGARRLLEIPSWSEGYDELYSVTVREGCEPVVSRIPAPKGEADRAP
jgi:predicted kinase